MEHKKHILLVEDESSMYKLITFKLERENFNVDIATDGERALQRFFDGQSVYNAIVLDLGLPVLDGMQVLKEVRSKDKDTPIIVLSAKSQEKDVLDGLKNGANDYLTKPFRPEELAMRLKKLLGEYA